MDARQIPRTRCSSTASTAIANIASCVRAPSVFESDPATRSTTSSVSTFELMSVSENSLNLSLWDDVRHSQVAIATELGVSGDPDDTYYSADQVEQPAFCLSPGAEDEFTFSTAAERTEQCTLSETDGQISKAATADDDIPSNLPQHYLDVGAVDGLDNWIDPSSSELWEAEQVGPRTVYDYVSGADMLCSASETPVQQQGSVYDINGIQAVVTNEGRIFLSGTNMQGIEPLLKNKLGFEPAVCSPQTAPADSITVYFSTRRFNQLQIDSILTELTRLESFAETARVAGTNRSVMPGGSNRISKNSCRNRRLTPYSRRLWFEAAN